MSTTLAGVASPVFKLQKWSLNRATDKIDITCFLDLNKVYVQGLADLKGTFEGLWDETETKPFAGSESASGCNLFLYPSLDAPTEYWKGPAWLDMSMDVDVNGAVKISGNFAAAGSWTHTFAS